MFLFTTPTAPSAPAATQDGSVVDAIRQGATATGVDFDYLLQTAKRESALDPSAKAPTSSATGLFQFIEQTWLGVVKSDGDKLGLGEQAKSIVRRSDGSFAVTDPDARQAILKLREQPAVASAVAGALTRQNRDALAASTGREPSAGELYMAHLLGAQGATDLIAAASSDPSRTAAVDFPDAARANRGIFYDRSGRPRSAGEVYTALAATPAGPGAGPPAAVPVSPVSATGGATLSPYNPPGLQGLFQTGARPGPLSDAVARIWRSNTDGTRGRANATPFFPRSEGSASDASGPGETGTLGVAAASGMADAAASSKTDTFTPVRADVPLPPIKPSFAPSRSVPSGAGPNQPGRTITKARRP